MKTIYRISLIIVIIMSLGPIPMILLYQPGDLDKIAIFLFIAYFFASLIGMGNLTSYITYCYQEKNLLKLSTLVYIAINVLALGYASFYAFISYVFFY